MPRIAKIIETALAGAILITGARAEESTKPADKVIEFTMSNGQKCFRTASEDVFCADDKGAYKFVMHPPVPFQLQVPRPPAVTAPISGKSDLTS